MKNLFVLIALCAASPAFSQTAPAAAPGRYVIVHSPHLERDTVLLDTVTGKTWILTEDTTRGAYYWQPLARSDNDAEAQAWVANHPVKNPAPQNSN